MQALWRFAWERFKVITSVVGDINARVISWLFYFTILVPFALISRFTGDPLRTHIEKQPSYWMDRTLVPTDLDSAKRQG